jgi:hypothetical protein
MSIGLTSEASLDLGTLQGRIAGEESLAHVRLTDLVGKTQGGIDFNAHTYVAVDDDKRSFSKLFIVPPGGAAANDPNVKTWLMQNPSQRLVCEHPVYISNSLANIAVVGNPT